MNQYIKQYQKSSIETASREQILIMLYDAAIQFLNKAKVAMANKQIDVSNTNLISAQNIIQEFINSMNKEVAPQLAENLISLYEYFLRRLVKANMERKIEPIDEVLKYLKSLKATWEQAIVLAQKEQQEEISKVSHFDSYDNDDDEDDEDNEEED